MLAYKKTEFLIKPFLPCFQKHEILFLMEIYYSAKVLRGSTLDESILLTSFIKSELQSGATEFAKFTSELTQNSFLRGY